MLLGHLRCALVVLTVLFSAAGAHAQTKAYIANTSANAATVIDTATGAVLGSIAVGTAPTRVAITPDGARAYVSNRDSASVSAIDTMTDSVAATIAVGANPGAIAISPDGAYVYVVLSGGAVQVLDAMLGSVLATIDVTGGFGGIALSPDGARAYVASGPVSVIDTATRTVVESFYLPEAGDATAVALSPDGTRAYFAVTGNDIFGSGGAVVALDTSSGTVAGKVLLGSLPGQIALTPDGGRAYVGIRATWVNTGYGAGFLPGRSVMVIDTSTLTAVRSIDLGAQAATAAGIAVTPDRSAVYVSVPRQGAVAVIDARISALKQLTPVAAGPDGVAVIPDPAAALEPYVIDAVDDKPSAAVPAAGVTAVANVLANDRLGGVPATLANVTLSEVASTDPRISLDTATGAIRVEAGAAVGAHSVAYRICERANPYNCDEANVVLSVRQRYLIDAVDDTATTPAGKTTSVRVLTNDRLGDVAATLVNVRLAAVSSTHAGVTLNASGTISVALGTPVGTYSLVYRICELTDTLNCDQATATVTVIPNPIDALNDTGATTRSGGTAVANVLANDRFGGVVANLTQVSLAEVSSTSPAVSLNPLRGSVVVAPHAPIGVYSLVYRICERASPSNCDEATVSVTVKPYVINAVSDVVRISSTLLPGTVLASVLNNDTFAGARATTATVTLSLVSASPATALIRLDPADGSLDVLERVPPSLHLLVYQICEIANPTNCDRATIGLTITP